MKSVVFLLLLFSPVSFFAQDSPPPPPIGSVPGRLMRWVAPVYPQKAVAAGIAGAVYLNAVIGQDGAVSEVKAFYGPVELRDAAAEAVSQSSYTPYLRSGAPAAVKTTMVVCFNLGKPLPAPCAPKSDGPVRVSGGIMLGSILSKSTPVYPQVARDDRVSGACVAHVIVDRNGLVRLAQAISGPMVLREPFLAAIRQWTYRPFLIDGEPVEVDMTVTINIHMGGNE